MAGDVLVSRAPARYVLRKSLTESAMVRLPLACLALLSCAACDGPATSAVATKNQQAGSGAEGDAVTLAEQTMDNAMNAMDNPPAAPTEPQSESKFPKPTL